MPNDDFKANVCILCECNCGLEIQLGGEGDRHLVRLKGDRSHPSSRGYTCEKAHRLDYYQNSRDRLRAPLRRRPDGSFEEIDWDTAIREVAQRLSSLRDQWGGETILYYGGGGQANHLPGTYATATRRALGSRFRSSPLAQEKTGEIFVNDRMMGGQTRADFEHCEVAFFLGKNPWHSHSIPRARVILKEIAADPKRTLIVVDPRRTETAALADIHLRVRPGGDLWLLTAMLGILVRDGLIDEEFVRAHVTDVQPVLEVLRSTNISQAASRAGVDEDLIRRATHAIGRAESMASFEDLGVQMNHHSTLVSYLHHLLVVLTGNVGRRGAHFFPTPFTPWITGDSGRKSPVVAAPIIAGLVPCNLIADEILTDHPRRYRGMIVEATNPAHSLADGPKMREALRSLDTLVVIDVAMTETARLASYVLPAPTQFEKAEASFFNFEFPRNVFHLRPRLIPPPPGLLPEAEIHARLCEALGAVSDADLAPLREAAQEGLSRLAEVLMERVISDTRLSAMAPVILYRVLPLAPELKEGAVLFGLALRLAMASGPALGRAGFVGSPLEAATSLFTKILESPHGFVFAEDLWDDNLSRVATQDQKIHAHIPELLEELTQKLGAPAATPDAAFPFVLTAGERRAYTANTLLRDPSWRLKDDRGALRMCPEDADRLGVKLGERVRVTTRRGSAVASVEVTDTMQAGHVSLPNGHGLSRRHDETDASGVPPNELTSLEDRDPFVGTPWHKHVPARIERVA